jgi:nitrogen fixation protein NifU and related proteins
MTVIQVGHDELEALHLCDGEGYTQEEAGVFMGISRGTVQRLLSTARRKVAEALVGQKALAITADLAAGQGGSLGGAATDEQSAGKGLSMSEQYSEKVMDHVHNPRNVGSLEDANVVVQAGDPTCGDTLIYFLRVENDVVKDIRFLIRGCGAAIATSSVATELVMGQTLDHVMMLDDQRIAAALDGLPEEKMHCSNMAATALHAAVEQYRATVSGKAAPITMDASREGSL